MQTARSYIERELKNGGGGPHNPGCSRGPLPLTAPKRTSSLDIPAHELVEL